jgi:hypothetical protein
MVKIDEELKNMEEGIRRLKVEYQIFFNGNRKKAPEDLRLRLERISQQLSERSDMTQSQRFLYNTLLTRYYTYRNLWRRLLQKQERGKDNKKEAESLYKSTEKEPAKEKFRISLSNPVMEEDKVKSLYDALLQYKDVNAEKLQFSFQQFEKYISTQTKNIRSYKGCPSVTYIIALEEGVVRFTATAEKS